MVKIASLSDIHGQWTRPKYLPADVLVCAGDLLKNYSYDRNQDARAQLAEVRQFVKHLEQQPYQEVFVVAGNHDFVFENKDTRFEAQKILEDHGLIYLEDESISLKFAEEADPAKPGVVEYEWIKFYGSPMTPWFHSWAFNFNEHDRIGGFAQAKRTWAKIPDDTNVLITHGPPRNILDLCPNDERVGCPELRNVVNRLVAKGSLKACYMGHIHMSAGIQLMDSGSGGKCMFKNTALLGEDYKTLKEITVEEI